MTDQVRLGWASAKVEDAQLTVSLEGELPDGWKDSFERTVKLLGAGEWGEIKVKKNRIQVQEVAPGAEDKLRHHLEAIVAQANAAEETRRQQAAQDAAQDAGEDDRGAGHEPQGPDAEMTERFRSFQGADENEDADPGRERSEDKSA